MSQFFFQIIWPVHVHLKTDKVDLKKRPPWKKIFLHFFSIDSSSRHEKHCQMLQRLFWLSQYSKNPRCGDYTTFFSLYKLFTFVLLLVLNGMDSSIGQWLSGQIPIFIPLTAELRQFPTFQQIWTNTFRYWNQEWNFVSKIVLAYH